VSKDLIEKFNNYLAQTFVTMGQIEGETKLPTPPHKLTQGDNISEKDKAHVFEGCVIMWTKQIKNILKLEPEQALKNGHPNPLVEIAFWKNKSQNLDSIHHQLQSEQVKKILKFLLQSKSTYYEPFKKLEEEVKQAKIEANDSYTYVAILEDWFIKLMNASDFTKLHYNFVPIMHTILLIWQNSQYYRTPSRLVVLIREICNAIIEQARIYVSGGMIFQLLEESPASASKKLQCTIDVCTKFKDAYFEYKGLAENQWQLTTNALFVRLDNFLERCHDILDLTKTIT
jgi:dynein heavy chain